MRNVLCLCLGCTVIPNCNRKLLEGCFDPVIDALEEAIQATLNDMPEIKVLLPAILKDRYMKKQPGS